jgi:hypothetical protein
LAVGAVYHLRCTICGAPWQNYEVSDSSECPHWTAHAADDHERSGSGESQ